MINYKISEVNNVTTKFIIDKEKNTIVCLLTVLNDIPNRLEKYGLADEKYDDIEQDDIRIYRGVAKCSPEDDWNETFGMRLAEYRAARMRQTDVNNELKKYIHDISRCIDNLYDYGMMKPPHNPQEKE